MDNGKVMIGLGEILWDILPEGKVLGGAPSNFAYHASALGNDGITASRIGRDKLGLEIIDALKLNGLEIKYIQQDQTLPTSTVEVELAADGQPKFTIKENVAWDNLQFTPTFRELAQSADVICFGSLAQRSPNSRAAIKRFLSAAPKHAIKIFDINIRQHYYTDHIIKESLALSQVLKLNAVELPLLVNLLNLKSTDAVAQCRELCSRFALNLVCLTKGKNGSVLATSDESYSHPGYPVEAVDSVGSGDAFTAAMVHCVLKGASLQQTSEAANRLGSHVATKAGATPRIDPGILESVK